MNLNENIQRIQSMMGLTEEIDDIRKLKVIDKVLEKLNGITNRRAQFRTVICLLWNKEVFYFEGICKGAIAETMHGKEGFGYDPIFIPEGASKSFAEMTMEEKNKFSHRQKAVTQLFTFLHSI